MGKTLSVNYTDSAISGGTSLSMTVPSLNYTSDFRVITDDPGECRITNLTSPLDQPERYRFAYQQINDIYKNSGIDPTLYYQTRRGSQILCQLTDVYASTDSADASYLALLPIRSHIVLTIPNNDLITEQVVQAHVLRTLAGLFDAKSSVGSRLKSVLRGALVPNGL